MTEPAPAPIPDDAKDRFWARVEKSEGCWAWTGSKIGKDGRGTLSVNGKNVLAPRLSWQIHNGPIPSGLFVCHSCDNPNCVNPDHLWLGTNSDNIRDAAKKGRLGMQAHPENSFFATERGKRAKARGSAHGSAKLDEAQVRQIRAALANGERQLAIAKRFGIDRSLVTHINSGRIWKHV